MIKNGVLHFSRKLGWISSLAGITPIFYIIGIIFFISSDQAGWFLGLTDMHLL
ncbi:MAG: hypothetical protein JW795_04110 [Chitinivibrionales bacterium]|nr:hypothetical protein [Chitinivibrionales bacterium]